MVLLKDSPGHLPLAPEPSYQGTLRGPGYYFPAEAEQALATVGLRAPEVDFGRGAERGVLGGGSPGANQVRAAAVAAS